MGFNKKEYMKKWREEHKNEIKEYNKNYSKEYHLSKMGRARMILGTYKRMDKESNREKGNLTARWIVDNIFSKPCAHCGETDWTKIGCNRLDNSKPHTMDNVYGYKSYKGYKWSYKPL